MSHRYLREIPLAQLLAAERGNAGRYPVTRLDASGRTAGPASYFLLQQQTEPDACECQASLIESQCGLTVNTGPAKVGPFALITLRYLLSKRAAISESEDLPAFGEDCLDDGQPRQKAGSRS